MKKIRVLTALLLSMSLAAVMLTTFPSITSAEQYEDFTYVVNDNSVTITGYTGSSTEVVIPDSINGYPVKSIDDSAFQNKNTLTSVTIPNSVTSLGMYAFASCYNLTSVTIPEGVEEILDGTFNACNQLSSVTLPEGLTYIGIYAFNGCSELTSITFPQSLKTIDDTAFSSCSSLTEVTFPENLSRIGHHAFNLCTSLTSVFIPERLIRIGAGAFNSCPEINSITVSPQNVTYDSREECNAIIETSSNTLLFGCKNTVIPNSVTSIGSSAFLGCSSLSEILIPSNITNIGSSAFQGCSGLSDLVISEGVTSISTRAFYGCSGLISVTIPSTLTSIDDLVFNNCPELINLTVDSQNPVFDSREGCNAIIETNTNTLKCGCKGTVIPDSVTSIGNYAFYECSNLEAIAIPDSIERIEDSAFYKCSSLTVLTLPESLKSIGENAFYACSSLTSVMIPEGVESIGNRAFYVCINVTSVTLPNSLRSIGEYAFVCSSSLTSVMIPEGVTSIGMRAVGMWGDNIRPNTYVINWVEGFVIYGISGSAAEEYANNYNRITFINHPNHSLVVDRAVEATCTEPGLTDGVHCSVCGSILLAQELIPAKGHTAEVIPEQAATCTEIGLTEGSRCSVCGEILSAQEEIPAIGHDWDEGLITKEPSCKEEGTILYTCRHDATHTRQEILAKTAHTPSAAVTENEHPATCTEDGSYDEVIYCSICDSEIERNTVIEPALGHIADEPEYIWAEDNLKVTARILCKRDTAHILKEEQVDTTSEITDSTCTEDGNIHYTAVFEDDAFTSQTKDVAISSTGHTSDDIVIENEIRPTDQNNGSYDEVVYCSVCGAELSRNTMIVPKVEKEKLRDAITAALQTADAVKASENGSDVDPSDQWVPQEVMDALQNALNSAQTLAETKDASQADVDAAVQTLETATEEFNRAKKDGTKELWVEKISLNRRAAEVAAKGSFQLEAIIVGNITQNDIVWTSSDPFVAIVNENGKVTGKNRGIVTITAKYKADNSKHATCMFEVTFSDAYYNLDGSGESNVTQEMETAINWVADMKITGETVSFGTMNSMTRGQFVRFLYRYAGNPKVTSAMIKKYGSQFKDVDKNYTHYKAIVWAVSKGLIAGYTDSTFKPNRTLSRNNVATILWKYAGSPKVSNPNKPFSDVAKSAAIAWGKSKKIFTGTKFMPKDNCLRGDFALFLYRYNKNR